MLQELVLVQVLELLVKTHSPDLVAWEEWEASVEWEAWVVCKEIHTVEWVEWEVWACQIHK